MTQHTIFRRHPRFQGYEVESDGSVWSTASNWRGYGRRQLTSDVGRDGYLRVRLLDANNKRCPIDVHLLVLETFVGQRPSAIYEARHLNGDKLDNSLLNLCWGTKSENALDRSKHHPGLYAGANNGFSRARRLARLMEERT